MRLLRRRPPAPLPVFNRHVDADDFFSWRGQESEQTDDVEVDNAFEIPHSLCIIHARRGKNKGVGCGVIKHRVCVCVYGAIYLILIHIGTLGLGLGLELMTLELVGWIILSSRDVEAAGKSAASASASKM